MQIGPVAQGFSQRSEKVSGVAKQASGKFTEPGADDKTLVVHATSFVARVHARA